MTGFLAVGANIDPGRNILAALTMVQARIQVLASSQFYRTLPLGRPEQPDYRNGVWKIESDLSPEELKKQVLGPAEAASGRIRTEDKYAARTLDLDILLYQGQVDPDIRTRIFLAQPLFELDSELVLPDTGEALKSLAVLNQPRLTGVDGELTNELRKRLV